METAPLKLKFTTLEPINGSSVLIILLVRKSFPIMKHKVDVIQRIISETTFLLILLLQHQNLLLLLEVNQILNMTVHVLMSSQNFKMMSGLFMVIYNKAAIGTDQ